jgi:hypothetical protein
MGSHYPNNPPVCPEPKVFVGQIPFESTTADVQALFAKYGTIRSCLVISGPDGRSKGCAMILYATWTEAEQAVEAENGTTHLGGSKPMVVKFADPPRRGDGPVVGIAPKKLFVGQVRAGCSGWRMCGRQAPPTRSQAPEAQCSKPVGQPPHVAQRLLQLRCCSLMAAGGGKLLGAGEARRARTLARRASACWCPLPAQPDA